MRWRMAVGAFAVLATLLPLRDAAGEDLLVSGQSSMFIIDGNGDGPGTGDCVLTATRVGATVSLTTTQDANLALVFCSMVYGGSMFQGSDTSSDFAGVDLTSSLPLAPSLPLRVEMVDETGMPGSGQPVAIDDALDVVTLFDTIDPQQPKSRGTGTLCSSGAGGVALKGTSHRDVSFLFDATLSSTHLRIPGLPFEPLSNPGTRITLDAYVPINPDKTLTLAGSNTPGAPIITY